MVRHVYEGGPPPAELRKAWLCGEQHLPRAGGLDDQDFVEMRRMRVVTNIYNTLEHLRGAQGTQIHTMSRGERLILKMLREEGLLG